MDFPDGCTREEASAHSFGVSTAPLRGREHPSCWAQNLRPHCLLMNGAPPAVLSPPLLVRQPFWTLTPSRRRTQKAEGCSSVASCARGRFPQGGFQLPGFLSRLLHSFPPGLPLPLTSLQSSSCHLPLPFEKDGFYTPLSSWVLCGY